MNLLVQEGVLSIYIFTGLSEKDEKLNLLGR